MDTIFYNGVILTQDPAQPEAEALALREGRILAVGSEAEARVRAGADAQAYDLAGGCLLPGFHDSHVHLTRHGLELSQLDLKGARTLQEVLERIAARARALPPGSWLLGSGFLISRWRVSELYKEDLDRAAPQNPVFLSSQDHHSAWANSRALELAGVSRDTPDPQDGVIVRDEKGEPTGLLLEHAAGLVSRAMPELGPAQLREALTAAARHLASLGVTTVHHMAAEPSDYWRQLALAASDESYGLRVWACFDQEHLEHAAALGVATGQGGRNFQVGGAKFFADGALGSMTAQMLSPYHGTEDYGMAVHGLEVMLERFPKAIEAGLTPVVHAIGDAAVRSALDALEATESLWRPLGMRPRLEHVQHLDPADAPRLARLGVVASLQPIHLRFDAPRIRELLPDRLTGAHPWRALLAEGAVLALGSDTPVATPDVMLSIRTALTREDEEGRSLEPAQRLTIEEVLAGYTSGAAYAVGWEERSGMLRAGYDADLTLLSHDPRETLDGLEVTATMKGGRWTFGG